MGEGFGYFVHGRVTPEGKPFVATYVTDGNGDKIAEGQMTPSESIALGVRSIQAAIEAERDSGMVRWLRETGAEDEVIGGMIVGMRRHRDTADPPIARPYPPEESVD